jgi:hypothetical protein
MTPNDVRRAEGKTLFKGAWADKAYISRDMIAIEDLPSLAGTAAAAPAPEPEPAANGGKRNAKR